MESASAVIDELERALSGGSTGRRVEVLHRVTGLFVNNAGNYTAEQIALFDDVMGRLVREIEGAAIVALSNRLAETPNAPPDIIRRLAWDDAVEVSGPVLAKSDKLTDQDLIELAGAKGQVHLAHIAARPALKEGVTDALLERGNSEVAKTLAANLAASFSEVGLMQLVMRADGDEGLAEKVAARSDLPAFLFRQLVVNATDKVRQKLLASARPDSRRAIERLLVEISVKFGKAAVSWNYAAAQRKVRPVAQDTELIRKALLEFAQQRELPELITALSLISAVPIDLVEQLVHQENELGLLVLCKAAALDWNAMYAILRCRSDIKSLPNWDFEVASATYPRLSTSSAQRALRFWQSQRKSR
jgi:uncharacterized protein (DUF2336 family)